MAQFRVFILRSCGNYLYVVSEQKNFSLQQIWQVVYKKQEQKRSKDRSLRDAAGGGEGQGQAIVGADSERTLCEEGLNLFDDLNVDAVGS